MRHRQQTPTSHRRPTPTRHNRRRPRLMRRVALGLTLVAIMVPSAPAFAKSPNAGGGGGKHNSAPSVVIKTPAAGAATSGSVAASGTASDTTSIASVSVQVDATGWKVATGTTSWNLPIDTTKLTSGTHTLYAKATDSSGLSTTTSESFSVNNTSTDSTAPSIVISSPASGSTVTGSVSISGTAADNVSVASVAVQVDGGAWQNASGTSNWTWSWNTTSVSNGSHSIAARATDGSGNTTTATTTVSVNNPVADTTPPSVTISSPISGGTVTGTVNVSGTASDNVGVASVQVQVDGGSWQSASGTGSWNWSWNTSGLASGSHTLTARSTDTSGNTSNASVTVNVPSSGSSSPPNTQGSWVSPEGVHINVNSAGSWTIAQVYTILQANALDLNKVGPDLTLNVQDTYTTQTTASACCSPSFTSYRVTIWLQGVNSSFVTRPDETLTHEFGAAWGWYWYFIGHNGSWSGYLTARWTTSDGSQTLATDSRVGSSTVWGIPEIIADDYRLLFGDSAAISERPTDENTDIPDPRNVPGLKTYLQNQFRSVS